MIPENAFEWVVFGLVVLAILAPGAMIFHWIFKTVAREDGQSILRQNEPTQVN